MITTAEPRFVSELAASSALIRLSPLLFALAFTAAGAPQIGMILVPVSWVWLGLARHRPKWSTAVLVGGTLAWLALTLLLIVPVSGTGKIGHN